MEDEALKVDDAVVVVVQEVVAEDPVGAVKDHQIQVIIPVGVYGGQLGGGLGSGGVPEIGRIVRIPEGLGEGADGEGALDGPADGLGGGLGHSGQQFGDGHPGVGGAGEAYVAEGIPAGGEDLAGSTWDDIVGDAVAVDIPSEGGACPADEVCLIEEDREVLGRG